MAKILASASTFSPPLWGQNFGITGPKYQNYGVGLETKNFGIAAYIGLGLNLPAKTLDSANLKVKLLVWTLVSWLKEEAVARTSRPRTMLTGQGQGILAYFSLQNEANIMELMRGQGQMCTYITVK